MAGNKGTRKPPGKRSNGGNRALALVPAVKQGAATLTGAGLSTVAAEVANAAMGEPAATETTKRQVITSAIAAGAGIAVAFGASKIKATKKFAAAILGGTALAVAGRAAPAIKELAAWIAEKVKPAKATTEPTVEGSKGISRTVANDRPQNGRVRDLVN